MAINYELEVRDPNSGAKEHHDAALTFTGSQIRVSTGRYPSVCVNDNGKIIEVHQPSFGAVWSNSIHYQVGTLLDDYTVRWAQEERELADQDGKFAAVALNSNNAVVVVYEASRKIRYHVGVLNLKHDKINWNGRAAQIAWGRYPAVALNNKGQAVVAYESNLGYRTYYRTAQLQADPRDNAEINWSTEERKLFTEGTNELSLAVNQTGCIVAAARGYRDRILIKLGDIQAGDGQNQFPLVNWKDTAYRSPATSKCHPVVSIDDSRNIVIAYQSKSGRQLSYQVGKISEKQEIKWLHQPRNYDLGCNPTIALCNNGKWFEEHETNSAYRGHKLFYRVGELHDSQEVAKGEIKSDTGLANEGENEDEDENK